MTQECNLPSSAPKVISSILAILLIFELVLFSLFGWCVKSEKLNVDIYSFYTMILLLIVALSLFRIIRLLNYNMVELSARFMLDTMPYKSTKIKNELATNIIDNCKAKKELINVRKETDFYGGMVGTAKILKFSFLVFTLLAVMSCSVRIIKCSVMDGQPLTETVGFFPLAIPVTTGIILLIHVAVACFIHCIVTSIYIRLNMWNYTIKN